MCLAEPLAPAETAPAAQGGRYWASAHRYRLNVRWSDLDSYGHVNNVEVLRLRAGGPDQLHDQHHRLGTRGSLGGRPPRSWSTPSRSISGSTRTR